MNVIRLLVMVLLGSFAFAGVHAADLALDDEDCASVLERWAEDPDSVPSRLVDTCKEQMAQPAAPVAAMAPAPEIIDPCADGGTGNVLCWGPWASLAPAAAAALDPMSIPEYRADCDLGSGLSSRCRGQIDGLDDRATPDGGTYPVAACEPGMPCGFATFVDGVTSTDDVENTSFRRFDMNPDGSGFVVDPGGEGEIDSVVLDDINIQPRPDGYENMRARGADGDVESRMIARVEREGEGADIELAADIWVHGNRDTRTGNSGYFAWGTATSAAGLELLNGMGISLTYTGPMSVDNATNASITVDFGSQLAWSGSWDNPAWSFDAGGTVNGVNLLSDPGSFSSNVEAGSVVQGALLGEPGTRQGLTHIIDINLTDGRHIKDVGLLRTPGID